MQLDIYAKDSFGQFIHFPSVVSQLKFKVPTFDGVLHLATPTNVKVWILKYVHFGIDFH